MTVNLKVFFETIPRLQK